MNNRDWMEARLRVLLGQTNAEMAQRFGLTVDYFGRELRSRGLRMPEAQGERVRLVVDWLADTAVEALAGGDLALAERRLRIAASLKRLKTDRKTDMAASDSAPVRKHVKDMSEVELRDEAARILGIELKSAQGGTVRCDDERGSRTDRQPPVSGDGEPGPEAA